MKITCPRCRRTVSVVDDVIERHYVAEPEMLRITQVYTVAPYGDGVEYEDTVDARVMDVFPICDLSGARIGSES